MRRAGSFIRVARTSAASVTRPFAGAIQRLGRLHLPSSNRIVALPRPSALAWLVTGVTLLAGCAPLAQQDTLRELEDDMSQIRDALARNESQLDQIRTAQGEFNAPVSEQLANLQGNLDTLGSQVNRVCSNRVQVQKVPVGECPELERKVVVTEADKLVLGEVERVWLDPPGMQVLARTDTGASSSSLHAAEITEFERDGEDWVRFEVRSEDENVVIERAVMKYVRVFQQADKSGSRRPVVEMRIHLGDVHGTFEFTLADRSHLEHDMILGRTFLTDMALVDVSRQFVQPESVAQKRAAQQSAESESASETASSSR